jgi:hypothetical protein
MPSPVVIVPMVCLLCLVVSRPCREPTPRRDPACRLTENPGADGKGDYMTTMTGPRLLCAVLFFGLLTGAVTGRGALAGTAGTPPAAPARAVGVTLNPGPGGEAQAYRVSFKAGATAIEAPQPWSTLEPSPGRIRLRDIAAIVQGVRSTPAMRIMAIPAAIETTRRSVPLDLRATPWGSRRMIGRYREMLRRLAHDLSRQVRYVSIANEADAYFSTHPDELPAFLRFARAAIADLHRRAPWVKAGVTVTYSGLTSVRPAVARRLAELDGATILTYYPAARQSSPLAGSHLPLLARPPLPQWPSEARLGRVPRRGGTMSRSIPGEDRSRSPGNLAPGERQTLRF